MSFSTKTNDVTPPRPRWRIGRWLVGVSALLLLLTTVVFVDETEFVLVERFGKIVAVYDQSSQSGLHFKSPWPIETVRRFDRRLQLLSPAGREAFTRDRKNVTVEAYVAWRISEGAADTKLLDRPAVRFFRSFGSIDVAEARLASRLQSVLTEQVGRAELTELLIAADSESAPMDGSGPLEKLSNGIRDELSRRTDESDTLRDRVGIEIVDVRIRRLNLPTGNMQAVFERMRSERQKIAERYRSAGLAENRMIRSQADRQAGELLAKANAEAERIRGEGDAEAIRILNEAYARDPEFASVVQTLEAYKQILNDRTTLVLSASSRLMKLLVEGIPSSSDTTRVPTPSAIEPTNAATTPAGASASKSEAR